MNQYNLILILLLLCYIDISYSTWLPKEVAQNIVDEWDKEEELRSKIAFRGTDRRSSSPFITGDSFRYRMEHICEDSNRCRMTPENVKAGQCVFVKTDQFNYFVTDVSKRITNPYIIISHNGDLSAPDGQDDAPRIGLPKYITSDILDSEYRSGRLIAHHGQNLWWKNKTFGESRPVFSHCLPIGFENRQYPVGKAVGTIYINALKKYIINRPTMTIEERNNRPLLLVAFYPKSRVPDRHGVLQILGAIPPRGQPKPTNTWYNETDLSHAEWLDGIVSHKFVLAPFGHGLDTHRISEILAMGGIPVTRRSTISSCYDDSDNDYYNTFNKDIKQIIRGSLPVVILDSWADLTKERLDKEWDRISKIPNEYWDWKRLFLKHWLDRIGCSSLIN